MANVLYIVVLTATLAALASARLQKYCNIKTCTNMFRESISGERHVGCLYDADRYGPNCGRGMSQGLTREQKQEILRVHNMLRQKVASGNERRGDPGPQPGSDSLGPLEWSDELATLAQLLANQCRKEHDECRNTEQEKVGQNVAWSSKMWWSELPADYKSQLATLTDMITGWYDEVSAFNRNFVGNFQNRADKIMTGHYTQLVWGDTKRVGCGFTLYSTEKNKIQQVLVCNYGPTGNWLGEPVYKAVNAHGSQPTSNSNGPRRIPHVAQRMPNTSNRFSNGAQRMPNPFNHMSNGLQRVPMGHNQIWNEPQRNQTGFNRIRNVPDRISNVPQSIPNVSYFTPSGQRLCLCAN